MRDHQLWQPSEPAWLLEGQADETRFLLALRDPDPDPDMSAPLEGMDLSTGEVVPLPVKYDPKHYLQSLTENFGTQQALAAAYDDACAALIGPNDQQKEGGRTFKKKSAWRKLARHFGISTRVVNREREWLNEDFIASVTVRAIAPWGQYAEAEGACCTDEESGRREITVSDAIATAETRATNRAISNLIAMGEVSADEITSRGNRPPRSDAPASPKTDADKKMPIGANKGQRLGSISTPDLTGTLGWCRGSKEPKKWDDLVAAIERVLEDRRFTDEEPAELVEADVTDDLPFGEN